MSAQVETQTVATPEITVFDLSRVIFRKRWWILASAATVAVIAAVIALVMTPVYRAEVLVVPVERTDSRAGSLVSELGGLTELAGIGGATGGDLETTLATLQSRRFINEFVSAEDLAPILFTERWDASANAWRESAGWSLGRLLGRPPAMGAPSPFEIHRRFDEEVLSVSRDRVTGLVIVAVERTDPKQAAEWANLLVARINAKVRDDVIEESDQVIRLLREKAGEMPIVRAIEGISTSVLDSLVNAVFAEVSTEYALKVIDPALEPEEPARPKPARAMLLGLMLGLLAGIFVVLAQYLASIHSQGSETLQKA